MYLIITRLFKTLKYKNSNYLKCNDKQYKRKLLFTWQLPSGTRSEVIDNDVAEWLYKTPPTCKEGNGLQCANNLHPRLNRNSGDAIS